MADSSSKDEDKLGDDRTYFGNILATSYLAASAHAAGFGGPGAYFAVIRNTGPDGSPTNFGNGFVINGSVGQGLDSEYLTRSDNTDCSTPCVDDPSKRCGSSKSPRVWAVYGPAAAAGECTYAFKY